MGFFVIEPEESGRPTVKPASDREPSCSFDAWLGDDIVRAHPLLLVTTELKDALQGLGQPAGFSFVRAKAVGSPFFERHNPDRQLPTFWSVEVSGHPGVDDFGIGRDGSVIVSARVVEVMGGFSLKQATLTQYQPSWAGESGDTRPRAEAHG